MNRKSTTRRGRDEGETGGRGSTHNNTTQKKRRSSAPQLICLEGGVATRTRHHTQILTSPLTGTLLRPLLAECLSYLDEESIRRMCCVSKQYHALIHTHPNLKEKYISILEIRAIYRNDGRRPIPKLVQNLYRLRDKLQHYKKIKIIGRIHCDVLNSYGLKRIIPKFSLQGVRALDIMSLPDPSSWSYSHSLLGNAFGSILPNLQFLDLSNARYQSGYATINEFLWNCRRLEKITWNNMDLSSYTFLSNAYNGNLASNLTELYMDDATFFVFTSELRDGRLSDFENKEPAGIFLFHRCTRNSKVLERLSIKNAKYGGDLNIQRDVPTGVPVLAIPQAALVKYVRNAPTSLRWFRSDLSPENITMLQLERPDIEFTN